MLYIIFCFFFVLTVFCKQEYPKLTQGVEMSLDYLLVILTNGGTVIYWIAFLIEFINLYSYYIVTKFLILIDYYCMTEVAEVHNFNYITCWNVENFLKFCNFCHPVILIVIISNYLADKRPLHNISTCSYLQYFIPGFEHNCPYKPSCGSIRYWSPERLFRGLEEASKTEYSSYGFWNSK